MKSEYISILRSKIGHMDIFNPVVCLVICKENQILLQKRSDNGAWAIHGGGLEPGEKFLDALYREINEELGIKPINPEFMGIFSGEKLHNIYPNGDRVYALAHVFLCEKYEGKIDFNDGEVKDIKWFDLDNLPQNLFEVDIPVIDSVKKFLKDRKVIVN